MKNSEVINIFVPEWVPLANKGEGAIVLGMADVLFPDKKVVLHLLDMEADIPYDEEGIQVYPGKWFYSDWRSREFGLGPSWEQLYSSGCSLLRNALNKLIPNWILVPQRPLAGIRKALQKYKAGEEPKNDVEKCLYTIFSCDYIVAGHNGGLDEYVCHTLNLFDEFGYKFGIFGSSLKPKLEDGPITRLFYKTIEKSEFTYVRNDIAFDWAKKYLQGLDVRLTPDPAFGMEPADDSEIEDVISRNDMAEFLEGPLIVLTTCEPAPIARKSFHEYDNPLKKLDVHRKLLADLVEHILNTTDARLVFLPHSLGPGQALDDRYVADQVLKKIDGYDRSRVMIMRDDINGKKLKTIIGKADLLIAERIHSIIGSVKVNTPFINLGSNSDFRVHGIVCKMLEAQKRTFFLDYPKRDELCGLFDGVWNNLKEVHSEQRRVNEKVLNWLHEDSKLIRDVIDKSVSQQG